jgi:hypothetical protein
MHRPDTPTGWIIELRVEKTVVLEEKHVLLLFRPDPDMPRLDRALLQVVQNLLTSPKSSITFGSVVRAIERRGPIW